MVRRLVIPLFFVTLVASSGTGAGERKKPGIEWREWSDDIFAQAKKQNRFVLLDLGAVWCHVIEEITYRDPKVIALINSEYLPVRVDQDSRPDLSNRCEDYGWPATIVFNTEGYPQFDKAAAFVCTDRSCSAPIFDPAKISQFRPKMK